MNKRMMALLALLAAVAVFIVIDSGRPDSPVVVEPPARPVRSESLHQEAPVAARASAVLDDQPVRDIFGMATEPSQNAQAEVEAPPPPPKPPLRLLGFHEEDGVRAAYVLLDGAVLMARQGQAVGSRYLVVTLGQDEIQIRDREGDRTYRISFGVNE